MDRVHSRYEFLMDDEDDLPLPSTETKEEPAGIEDYTISSIMDCFNKVEEVERQEAEDAKAGKSNIIDPTKKVATKLKNADKKVFSGKDDHDNYWAAAYIPTKKALFVMFRDKRTSENSNVVITKENGEQKLRQFFDGLYTKEKEEKATHNQDVLENCSAGATCAGCVATIDKPMGKMIKRKNSKKKKVSENYDTVLFKESILNELPVESIINGHTMKYFFNEGKNYLSIDNCLVKTFDKNVMLETVDQFADDLPVSAGLLEDYSCYEMNLLMEDGDVEIENIGNENSTDKRTAAEILAGVDNPSEAQQLKTDIENKIKTIPTGTKVDAISNVEDKSLRNQEFLTYDPVKKAAVIKDTISGETHDVQPTAIKRI